MIQEKCLCHIAYFDIRVPIAHDDKSGERSEFFVHALSMLVISAISSPIRTDNGARSITISSFYPTGDRVWEIVLFLSSFIFRCIDQRLHKPIYFSLLSVSDRYVVCVYFGGLSEVRIILNTLMIPPKQTRF